MLTNQKNYKGKCRYQFLFSLLKAIFQRLLGY